MFIELDPAMKSDGLYFLEFGENLRLREIIIGANSALTRSEVADALGDMADEVSSIKARLAFRSFRVVRQRLHLAWV